MKVPDEETVSDLLDFMLSDDPSDDSALNEMLPYLRSYVAKLREDAGKFQQAVRNLEDQQRLNRQLCRRAK